MSNRTDYYNMILDAAAMAVHPVGVYTKNDVAGWGMPRPWHRRLRCFFGFHFYCPSYIPVYKIKNVYPGQIIPTWLECIYCGKEKK